MEEKAKSNRRRRERALKMRAEISESAKASEDSCEESVPRVRTKPPRPRKKNKEPLFEEDVVEGFAFLAFKNYEDLEWQGGRAAGAGPPPEAAPCRAGRAGRRAGVGCNTGGAGVGNVVLRNNGGARHATLRPPPRCHKGGIRAAAASLHHSTAAHAAAARRRVRRRPTAAPSGCARPGAAAGAA
ncbi:hypothetical protein O3P69_013349 [Scylla paramamosain]|uniref:Uncharacterized protein n=1 Tax=Scylla paramamosain TaxID=85552 RepID=A0AAW0TZZ0_SCYPA